MGNSNLTSEKKISDSEGRGGTLANSNLTLEKNFFSDSRGGYITKNQNVMLTQNPTKIQVEIENQRFSFHSLWQTRNIGRQGRGVDRTKHEC